MLLVPKRNECAMPECVIVEIGMQMHSNCTKKKTFTIPISNETAINPKIVLFKACIFNQSIMLYKQSQSE